MDQEAVKALFNLHASPIVSKESISLKMLPQLDLNQPATLVGDQQDAAGTLYALMKANGTSSSFLNTSASKNGITHGNTFAALAKTSGSNNNGLEVIGLTVGASDGRLRSRSFAASSSLFMNGDAEKMYNSKDHNGFVIQQASSERQVRRPRSFSSHAGSGKILSSSSNGNGHISSIKSVLSNGGGSATNRARTFSASSANSIMMNEDATEGNISSSSAPVLGAYSAETRQQRIQKFLDKRQRRIWRKRIKYDVRKNFADSRLRVKGRFVRKEDEDQLRSFLQML